MDSMPAELKEFRHWVTWKQVRREGKKPGRAPVNPATGKTASVTEAATWGSYDEAVAAMQAGKGEGIGFVLTLEDPYIGVDLDGCVDPDTGGIAPWAKQIVETLNSYTEYSPSGEGLRIFIKGKLPPKGRKSGDIEFYDDRRFMTVTGNHIPGTSETIEERQQEIEALHQEVFGGKSNSQGTDDSILLRKIQQSPQGRKFDKLFRGDWADDYPTQSESDLAMANILAYWANGDESIMDRLFRQSGLMREKWDRVTGDSTYGQRTIEKAIDGLAMSPKSAEISVNPERYFNKSQFIPKRLAEEIMKIYHIKFAGGRFWIYEDGVYKQEREDLLAREIQRLLADESRDNRIREVLNHIRREALIDLPTPDAQFINVLNGRLNWRKGKLEPHDPKHFDIVQLPVTYDPDAKCDVFDRYLESTFNSRDLVQLVEEILGYSLIPDTRFEAVFILYGTGANGKSVFLNVIRTLLGPENTASVSMQDLAEQPFFLEKLVGKLVNLFADLDPRGLKQTGILKSLVSGDPVTAQRKYGDPFTFINFAKFLYSTNQLPPSKDRTHAFYRRLIILPFENTFTEATMDRELREKLSKPSELSGILNIALKGLQRLYQQGQFTNPDVVAAASQKYKSQNGSVAEFVNQKVEVNTDEVVLKLTLYEAYRNWCQARGVKPESQRILKEHLKDILPAIEERRIENRWHWKGIRLVE